MTIIPTSDAINETTVMRQIRKLADCINSRDGGMIADIDFDKESNTYVMVITFADGTSQRFEWDTSPIDISNITGSVSNGNLTITIFMSNGTSHAFTCPLNGMATESYVDTGLALKADKSDTYTKTEVNTLNEQNVKKTGTSVVTGDVQVPTIPVNAESVVNSAYVNDATDGVNNIVHKGGFEVITGPKCTTTNNEIKLTDVASRTTQPNELHARDIIYSANDGSILCYFRFQVDQFNHRSLYVGIYNPTSDNYDWTVLAEVLP